MFISSALLGGLAIGALLNDAPHPAPVRSTQHGSFELALSADTAFPLFSPEGERTWVEGWDPKPISPPATDVRWEPNTVFQTKDNEGKVLTWWTVEVDRVARKADYIYLTESRAVRVTVRVNAVAEDRCTVGVSYLITALTEQGSKYVAEATDEQMKQKMAHWKGHIDTAIRNQRTLQPNVR
jgi:hypothetical protein